MGVLSYCGNVHPTPDLPRLWEALDIARACREELAWERLGYGLWIAPSALPGLEREPGQLRDRLEAAGLLAVTANAFPCGDFHAPVVKRAVYHPDWTREERRVYTVAVARLLSAVAPPGRSQVTVSTLPLGHRGEGDRSVVEGSAENLCRLVTDLENLRDSTGVAARVAIEPEPGCWIETAAEAVAFFEGPLAAAARQAGLSGERVRAHLGLCFDTCHHAVVFEEPVAAIGALAAAGIPIYKSQLSSALELTDPADGAARAALAEFDEPRFLHQVRVRRASGIDGVDDLPQASSLPVDGPWRVHFHVPVHRPSFPPLGTTRTALVRSLAALLRAPAPPDFEVETYTWGALPAAERPQNPSQLAQGLARELAWIASAIEEQAP